MKQNTFDDKKNGMLKKHRKNKFWKKAVALLSCVTVFCTSYTMILPAMTMSETTYCGQEEGENHTHTLQCYSNPNADLENEANWTATIPSLTGNWNEDVLAVADSQLGYHESAANYHVSDNNEKKGYTRYGAWMNDPYADWNTDFVLFCLHYANVDANALSLSNDISTWTSNGAFVSKDSYTPNAGDLIVLDENNDGAADHAAIITEANGNAIRIVEGDLSDAVTQANYDTTDARVIGYIRMPQNPAIQTVAETAEETSAPEATAAPEETAQPEEASAPAETAEPEAAVSAQPTSTPEAAEATAEPQETAEPETMAAPEATSTPEAAAAPEATTMLSKAKRRLLNIFRAPEKSVDISDRLTDATITIDGKKVTEDTWNVKAGSSYDLKLTFKETTSNQFPNDNTWMTYQIPKGLNVENLNTTFDMLVDGKTISGNKMIVDKTNSVIKFQWNTSDPNFQRLVDSNNLHFDAKIHGSFDSSAREITFSDDVKRNIDVTDTHDAKVEKSGYYDSNDGKIHYTVTVTSTGTSQNVTVTDNITGTALTYDKNVKFTSTKGATATMNTSGNGFTARIPSMSDGEQVIFTYTASVDFGKLKKSGTVKEKTSNEVNIICPGDSNPNGNSSTNVVTISSISKNAQNPGDTYEENGKTYRNITWNIKANEERKKHLTYISDSIAQDSQGILSYSGDGLMIVVTYENGAQENRKVKWTASSIEKTNTGWTYTPPTSDGKASYDVTYTTKADVTSLIDSKNVSNTAETDYNSTTGSTTIDSTEENKLGASKKVSAVSSDKVTWEITVDVPAAGLDKLVVTDTLPSVYINDHNVYDSLDDNPEVTGLEGSEDYSLDKSDPSKFVMTFFKDKSQTKTGINSGKKRTLTIKYTTSINREWVEYARQHKDQSYLMTHRNNAIVSTFGIEKNVSAEVTINSDQSITKTEDPQGEGTYTDADGTTWQYFPYNIVLTGATEDNLTLEDTFDTRYLKYFDGVWDPVKNPTNKQWDAGFIWGGTQYGQGEGKQELTVEETSTGIKINTGILPRQQDGTLYSHYRIRYYLKARLDDLNKLAAENGGTATLTNSVTWGTQGASADVSYSYHGVSKTCIVNGNVATYTIDVNPSALELNEGNPMALEDTFSNLLIDVSTINISATDKNGKDRKNEVNYDFSGNTGTFTIPDSTHVVITYQAHPIGTVGSQVQMSNKAQMKAYKSETSKTVTIVGNAGGGGDILHLKLMKYEDGNMKKRLAGAVFQIFDADGTPLKYDTGDNKGNIITFVTDVNGYVDIKLSNSTGYSKGLSFGQTYKLKEIKAPDGYQLDESYIPFTISEDGTTDPLRHIYPNNGSVSVPNRKVFKVDVKLKKVDSQDASKTLSGAKFDLYGSDYVNDGAVNTNATLIQKGLTTDKDGTVLLSTLTSGTYYLVETQAPEGYGKEKDPIRLEVKDGKVTVTQGVETQSGTIIDDGKIATTEIIVTDPQAYNLPKTGGTGTVMIYVAGGVLVAVAVVMLVMQKRKKS